MTPRLVEDFLREEYHGVERVYHNTLDEVLGLVRSVLGPMFHDLQPYEHLSVEGRVKSCESAIAKLRLRQQGGAFDQDVPAMYSLRALSDIVAVRVSAFPRALVEKADEKLRSVIRGWTPDHITVSELRQKPLAFKYTHEVMPGLSVEYQVVSALVAGYWRVEHDAFYKPHPDAAGAAEHPGVKTANVMVLQALLNFEEQFELALRSG